MRIRLLVVTLLSCGSPSPNDNWTEHLRPNATLDVDGLYVVVNREQYTPLPSQGAGEGGDMSKRRVDVWRLTADSIERTRVGAVKTWPGGLDLDSAWRGEWRAGHLWTWSSSGLLKDDQLAAPFSPQSLKTSALGRSFDGGVALAVLRTDKSVAVWVEGESSPRELPALEFEGKTVEVIRLSEGPRFGLVVGAGGQPPGSKAWAEGDAVTRLDAGPPLAFYAAPGGTQLVTREYSAGYSYPYTDTLHADGGMRELASVSGPAAYTELDFAAIEACVVHAFDPEGNVVTLESHVEGFTLRAGGQTFNLPGDGSNDVSWCSVASDGQTIHVVWIENVDRRAKAPSPHLLHYVTVTNGVVHAAPRVDIAADLLEPFLE